MNEQSQQYWNEFWQGKTAPANVTNMIEGCELDMFHTTNRYKKI